VTTYDNLKFDGDDWSRDMQEGEFEIDHIEPYVTPDGFVFRI